MGLKAGKGSQRSVLVPSGTLQKCWEMPTVSKGSTSKSDATRPRRNPGNVALSATAEWQWWQARLRRLTNWNLWLREKTLTENTLVLQVWGFSVGLTTPPSKNDIVTETQKHQTHIRCPVGRGSSERMTPSRESQQQREPARPILLSPRQHTLKKRKWTWIGHILRRSNTCIARQALGWNPQGSRREEDHETPGKETQKGPYS